MENSMTTDSQSIQGVVFRPNKSLFYLYLALGFFTIIFLIGIPIMVAAILWYKFSYITVGEKGVELRKGWLNVTHKQVPYAKINTVEVYVSFIDQFFKTGQIKIFTGNDIQGIVFFGINSPKELQQLIESRSEGRQANTAQPSQSAGTSAADELAKYADLKNKGIISQAEFDNKKKQLLG